MDTDALDGLGQLTVAASPISYSQITEEMPDDEPSIFSDWNSDGVVRLPELLEPELMADYEALRARLPLPGGWTTPCPYLKYDEIKNLCLYRPLTNVLEELVRGAVGLHLNLTGWVSTQRAWHSDYYLNPPEVGTGYLAVWMALDDISADSGPFQYVPGSHRWPTMTREKILSRMEPGAIQTADWPSRSEAFVTEACRLEIERRQAEVVTYLPKRGDVLIWHSRLLHQGSIPRVLGTQRKALISHYSRISSRPDMAGTSRLYINRAKMARGYYFDLNVPMAPEEQI